MSDGPNSGGVYGGSMDPMRVHLPVARVPLQHAAPKTPGSRADRRGAGRFFVNIPDDPFQARPPSRAEARLRYYASMTSPDSR